jgi:hypothetical protein
VALEKVVVPPRLVAAAMLRVHRASHRPEGSLLPLEPDHDPLLAPRVVEPTEHPLGAAAVARLTAHGNEDTIGRSMALGRIFSFLFQRSSAEERVAAYVIREHDRGRNLAEILEDRYVQNRLTPDQRARLLDRPEVIKAIGNDTIESARGAIA